MGQFQDAIIQDIDMAKPTGGEHSTGLGLSIVKKYVDVMGGRVWCESVSGKGSNFIVALRRSQ